MRRKDIAEIYLPEEYAVSQEIAMNAVGKALEKLIPRNELDELITYLLKKGG